MRKFTLSLFILIPLYSFSYNWTLYSPDSIHANNICFNAFGHDVICTSKGLCINDGAGYTWVNYNYNLSVWDAVPFPDSTNLLLCIMGDGSYSDGIYKFDMDSHTFSVVEYVPFATFLRYNPETDLYYAASRYYGLYTSSNGINWDTIPYFTGKGCADIDFYSSNITVIQENNILATYFSHDNGATWGQSSSNIPLHDISYRSSGKLFGVFTGMSNSSGLYSSADFGETWVLEQWDDNINTVGFDVVGNVFTGWHSSLASTGVAIYEPSNHSFTFYNSGLGNTEINAFCINEILSSIAIFVCTDSGVYFCNNYLSSVADIDLSNDAVIYPNPASEILNLRSIHYCEMKDAEIELYNVAGKRVLSKHISVLTNSVSVSELNPGLYFYDIKNSSGTIASGKVAVE